MRALLEAGLSQVVTGEAAASVLPPFNGVYLTDATRLVWGGQGVKLVVLADTLQSGHDVV